MKTIVRVCILPVLICLTGCATTEIRFTSQPPGAAVSKREFPFFYPFHGQPQWVPMGTTPCIVVARHIDPPLVAKVSLGTNQFRYVGLDKKQRMFNGLAGPYIMLAGGFETAWAAAGFFGTGGAAVGGVVFGAGVIALGFELCNHAEYYEQNEVHVDFNRTDQYPSTWVEPPWYNATRRK